MNTNELILKQTLRDTRETLVHWNGESWRVIGHWIIISFGITIGLLSGVLTVAEIARPDATAYLPPIFEDTRIGDAVRPLIRNLLVLSLHGFVCLAGFMAMRTLPAQVEFKTGIDRWIHHHASAFAMVWVTVATLFSISTQIYILGHNVADLSYTVGSSPPVLMLTVLPHALPELTAVFLPLAAFLVASRRGQWNHLLAATLVTVTVALPVLLISALIEAYLWPELLRNLLAV